MMVASWQVSSQADVMLREHRNKAILRTHWDFQNSYSNLSTFHPFVVDCDFYNLYLIILHNGKKLKSDYNFNMHMLILPCIQGMLFNFQEYQRPFQRRYITETAKLCNSVTREHHTPVLRIEGCLSQGNHRAHEKSLLGLAKQNL